MTVYILKLSEQLLNTSARTIGLALYPFHLML